MAKASKGKGSRAKLREYFTANVGKILTSEQLREIAGTSEWARRVRELRNEEGLNIVTHNDRSHLKVGQYILVGLNPLPSFERSISKETRAFVLDRNGFTCQMCGAAAGEPHPYDIGRKTRLHLGHIIDKSMGGTDEPSNLRAICSICNEGASNLTLNRPQAIKLIAQVRRAPSPDQLDILKWLIEKFPAQANALLNQATKSKPNNNHMNTIGYFEIQSSDPGRDIKFYETVFGWKFTREEFVPIEYYRIETGTLYGGLLKRPAKLPPAESGTNAFTCSIQVDSFDDTSAIILDKGGQVALPKFAIPGRCWQGYFIDPDNNVFGLFEVDENAK